LCQGEVYIIEVALSWRGVFLDMVLSSGNGRFPEAVYSSRRSKAGTIDKPWNVWSNYENAASERPGATLVDRMTKNNSDPGKVALVSHDK